MFSVRYEQKFRKYSYVVLVINQLDEQNLVL